MEVPKSLPSFSQKEVFYCSSTSCLKISTSPSQLCFPAWDRSKPMVSNGGGWRARLTLGDAGKASEYCLDDNQAACRSWPRLLCPRGGGGGLCCGTHIADHSAETLVEAIQGRSAYRLLSSGVQTIMDGHSTISSSCLQARNLNCTATATFSEEARETC